MERLEGGREGAYKQPVTLAGGERFQSSGTMWPTTDQNALAGFSSFCQKDSPRIECKAVAENQPKDSGLTRSWNRIAKSQNRPFFR